MPPRASALVKRHHRSSTPPYRSGRKREASTTTFKSLAVTCVVMLGEQIAQLEERCRPGRPSANLPDPAPGLVVELGVCLFHQVRQCACQGQIPLVVELG